MTLNMMDERRELKKAGQEIVQSKALFPWEAKQ